MSYQSSINFHGNDINAYTYIRNVWFKILLCSLWWRLHHPTRCTCIDGGIGF